VDEDGNDNDAYSNKVCLKWIYHGKMYFFYEL